MHSYLCNEYGRLGFIITRDEKYDLFVGPELDTTRFYYDKHGVLIVKLTGKYLCSLLSKLRSAERLQKGDPSEIALNKLLDTYIRSYMSGSRTVSHAPNA
ncbi:MAG: ATP-binding protein, partial [Verrucomicrobiia bacterium]